MKAMLNKNLLAIEKLLYARGFVAPGSRRVIARQILFACASLAFGIVTSWFTLWPLAFAVGTIMATGNLYFLGKSAETSTRASSTASNGTSVKASAVLAVLYVLLYWVRLAVTGLLLYTCLVRFSLPFTPLIAGLSTVVASLSIMGFSRIMGKACKEA